MDLTWTHAEQAFRAEARAWLAEHLELWREQCGGVIHSGDTHDGFAQHLVWERMLFDDRWAVVSWPKAYRGREASLWEWIIFEEEYYAAGGPQRLTQHGIFLSAPSSCELRTQPPRDVPLPRIAAG